MNTLLNKVALNSVVLKSSVLKPTTSRSILLLPLLLVSVLLVPVLAFGADHSNRGHDGGRHDNYAGSHHNDYGRDQFRGNDHHSNVRVNIGIGAPLHYGSIFNNWSYGVGYSSYGGQYYINHAYPYSVWDNGPRPVIVERNTYIEQPSTRVYTNREETSLLRDLDGRCFERSYDRNGTELRTELDPSACNF